MDTNPPVLVPPILRNFDVSIVEPRAKTWFCEEKWGVGAGDGLSALSCGPSFGTEERVEPLKCA